jgi:hypothetical protein
MEKSYSTLGTSNESRGGWWVDGAKNEVFDRYFRNKKLNVTLAAVA